MWEGPENAGLENAGSENAGPWLFCSKYCFRVLCMSRCIVNDKLFSGGLQINVIAILFCCNFHMLPVLRMTLCFRIMANGALCIFLSGYRTRQAHQPRFQPNFAQRQ